MSKMNGPTRKKIYHIIAERDGEYCRCCRALPTERALVIDHRDNNNKNKDKIVNQNKTKNGSITKYSRVYKIIAKNFSKKGCLELLY